MPALRRLALAAAVVLGCTVHRGEAKAQLGSVRLEDRLDSRWQYVSKFGFAVGDGEYDVRLRLREPPSSGQEQVQIDLDLYMDEEWPQVEMLSPCERISDSVSRRAWPVTLEASGEWSEWRSGVLQHRVRPHIWYFAVSDCRYTVRNTSFAGFDVGFEFRARQGDGSELGVEMRYMLPVNVAVLALLTGLFGVHFALCRRHLQSAGELHPVIWALTAAMALQYFSQVLHAFHLYLYHADGQGLWTMDTFSENLAMSSQVMHTFMFIALAQGYSLVHRDLGELELSKLEITAVLVTHLMLVGLGNMEDGASHLYHELEGTAGWLILGLRLLLCCKFWRSVRATMKAAGPRLHSFLCQLRLAGSAYLLAYPLTFLIVQVFAPYLRHPVMQVGLLITQLASSLWLGYLFLGESTFYQVSELSCSLLPGCAPAASGSPRLLRRRTKSGLMSPERSLSPRKDKTSPKFGSVASMYGTD